MVSPRYRLSTLEKYTLLDNLVALENLQLGTYLSRPDTTLLQFDKNDIVKFWRPFAPLLFLVTV